MYVKRPKKKIFLSSPYVDLGARITNKRQVRDVIENDDSGSAQYSAVREMLTVEIACYIDQRVLLEEEISDIKVYVSNKSMEFIKMRQNLVKDALSPALKRRVGSGTASRNSTANDNSVEKNEAFRASSNQLTSRVKRNNLINVAYDIDNLNQNLSMTRFSDLRFLTKFNVNQILNPLKIKNIQNFKQTDAELFGHREVYRVRKITRPKFRNVAGKTREITTDSLPARSKEEVASIENFRNSYFRSVSLGRDPIRSFQERDPEMTIEDRVRGSKSISKPPLNGLRRHLKSIVTNRINDDVEKRNDLKVFTSKVSNRNRICKTNFVISRKQLRKLSGNSGHINLIFFAFDKTGKRIDSFEYKIALTQLFLTEVNPPLDFSVISSRNGRGNIVTHVGNKELQSSKYNLYQKSFSKNQNYMNSIFEKESENFIVGPRTRTKLLDGKVSSFSSQRISKIKNVFQRVTPNYFGRELANTISSSTSGQKSERGYLSCTIYAVQELEEDVATVTIANISEDVYAVLPVKRVAKGNRGSDFAPVKISVGNNLVDATKVFVRRSEETLPVFTFEDADVEDGVTYEYAAFLYSRSGHKELSGNRFLERKYDREGLISAEVTATPTGGSGEFDRNASQITREISFEVILNREEDDVDKIINSIFGDNRSLFNDDLSSISDASNLLYGVRVHRIDTQTGDYVFVGSFRGFKQEDQNSAASTDIPKTYRATFTDQAPAFSKQIYKFDPYVIPPSQVLDKVFDSLKNIITSKNRSRSTLNKLLVSKQKVINTNIISQVGTKIASIDGRSGAIVTPQALLERNRNDIFLEGVTGDLVYEIVQPSTQKEASENIELEKSEVKLVKTLDRDGRSKNYIPKNIAQINFETSASDVLMDFYVVLKKFNKDPEIIIDGCIHSLDINSPNALSNRYRYLSEVKTRVGLIRYYLVGVNKNGTLTGPTELGSLVLEGE